MKTRALAALAWFTLAATICAYAPKSLLRARPPAADSAPAFTPDKGKFRIVQEGNEVGTESFELSSTDNGWVARGDTSIKDGKNESRSTGQLRLKADGTPVHYDWTSQTPKKAKGAVDFAGSVAKTSITVEAKDPFHQDFTFKTPRIAVLDNNLYDQYAILAALYDWKAAGKQSFPVLIPQDLTPGSIDLESMGTQSNLEVLRASTPDLEIMLYLDAKHHLVRLEAPAAKVVVTRQ